MALDPKLAEAHYFLGRVFELSDAPDLALKAYHACLRVDPEHALAQDGVGRVRG